MSNKNTNIPTTLPLIREKARGLATLAQVLELGPQGENIKYLREGLEQIEAGFKAIDAAEKFRKELWASSDTSWPR
jgi:hypothetical protein